MPGQPPPLTDERALLLAYIAQQRDGIRNAAFGLSDEQARLTPTAGTLSIGGLVKHVAATEQHWMDLVLQRDRPGSVEDYVDGFRLRDDETLAGALAHYADVARATEAEVNDIDDLNRPVPVPRGVPWFPQDVDAWSVRWVLLHVIEETARHAGHADIIRESIDGATMYALMAGVEGWPETAWLKPWRPPEGEAAEGARNTHCRRRRLRKSLSTVAALAALTGTQTAWAAGTPRATAASNASRDDNNPARQYTTPSVAVDPRNPMRVVISYMEARSRRCSIVVSNDGGSTWSRPDGSASPDGYPFCYELQFASFSNPEAFGRSRTLYQGLNGWDTRDGGANSGNVSAVLGRSDDLGESWKTTPVRDARGKAGTDVESNGPMHSVVVDTRTGSTDRVYVGWSLVKSAQKSPNGYAYQPMLSYSTDGGVTFAPPVNLAESAFNDPALRAEAIKSDPEHGRFVAGAASGQQRGRRRRAGRLHRGRPVSSRRRHDVEGGPGDHGRPGRSRRGVDPPRGGPDTRRPCAEGKQGHGAGACGRGLTPPADRAT